MQRAFQVDITLPLHVIKRQTEFFKLNAKFSENANFIVEYLERRYVIIFIVATEVMGNNEG